MTDVTAGLWPLLPADERRFLIAVVLAPWDSTLRGVYADWLEERGRSAEADAHRAAWSAAPRQEWLDVTLADGGGGLRPALMWAVYESEAPVRPGTLVRGLAGEVRRGGEWVVADVAVTNVDVFRDRPARTAARSSGRVLTVVRSPAGAVTVGSPDGWD